MMFYDVIALQDKTAKINIHSQIGMNWFGEGVDSKGFIDAVEALGEIEEIDLHINSPGGNVNDGVAIYNHLKQHNAKITTYIDGSAASIASVIAMAGDEIIMPLGSTMFVHDPLTWVVGNADEMRDTAEHLDKIKNSIIDIYVSKTNMSRDEVAQLMSDETTLNAEDAVEWGFASKAETYDMPVLNSFDAQLLKKQVMAVAESENHQAQIKSLQNTLNQANAKIAELEKTPEPANAKEIIHYCKEKQLTSLSAQLIENNATMAQVETLITTASQIKDICAGAGIESGRVIENINSPVEMVRFALSEQVALNDDDDVSNHLRTDLDKADRSVKTPDMGVIYANRKQSN